MTGLIPLTILNLNSYVIYGIFVKKDFSLSLSIPPYPFLKFIKKNVFPETLFHISTVLIVNKRKKMETGVYRIAGLISRRIQGKLTEDEQQELKNWINASETNRWSFEYLCDHRLLEKKLIADYLCNKQEAYNKFLRRRQQDKIRSKKRIMYWSAAACLVLSISINLLLPKNGQETVSVITQTTVLPGESRAILTLGNGQQMQLNAGITDTLLQNEGATANISQGTISYSAAEKTVHTEWNTLQVPRKGEFFISLSDGTKVWLNSESRLCYPVAFEGTERRVRLEGEAYFDVSENKSKPFIVEIGKVEVRVLGTAFNLRAYGDEPGLYATLERGRIELNADHQKLRLNPNEQGIIDRSSGNMLKQAVNVALYTGWKDGRFIFENKSLEEMMKTLERWYDIKVFFKDQAAREVKFSGNLKRYENFEKVTELLEMTKLAQFEIKGNVVFISR